MRVSRTALAAILAIGSAAAAVSATAQQPAGRTLTLSREERAALTALQTALAGPDRTAQDAALVAARAAARGADARYAVARHQLLIAQARGDAPGVAQAVDALLDSGQAQPGEIGPLLANQASRAFSANDLERTDRLLTRLVASQPDNAAFVADLGQLKARRGDRAGAVTLLQRAIALNQAAGRPSPESWHLRALALAFDGRLAPQALALARGLAGAYPTPVNWRDALLVYRELAAPDAALDLDIRRLSRATQALSGERDYLEFAEALSQSGAPGEAKAVLDEGVSRGMLEANKPVVAQMMTALTRRATQDRAALARLRTHATGAVDGGAARTAADAHFAFGQYAEAAELYGLALQKGGADVALVNTRLGAALALAGRRPEAEAAFQAVAGPRAELAGFWRAWLARRAG